jgi:hypothetical protein
MKATKSNNTNPECHTISYEIHYKSFTKQEEKGNCVNTVERDHVHKIDKLDMNDIFKDIDNPNYNVILYSLDNRSTS